MLTPSSQLTNRKAPAVSLPLLPTDCNVQAIVEVYKDEPGNLKFVFKYSSFSIADPQFRIQSVDVVDINGHMRTWMHLLQVIPIANGPIIFRRFSLGFM